MARLILLDSGPLGLIVRAPGRPQVLRCIMWLKTISAAGATVVIPEIAHYEVRRELFRIRAVGSLRRLAGDVAVSVRHYLAGFVDTSRIPVYVPCFRPQGYGLRDGWPRRRAWSAPWNGSPGALSEHLASLASG